MTIARTIAITAAVWAAIGMTTHAEAAKRKAAGGSRITLIGCAYTELVCGTVMNFAGNIYVLVSGYGVHPLARWSAKTTGRCWNSAGARRCR